MNLAPYALLAALLAAPAGAQWASPQLAVASTGQKDAERSRQKSIRLIVGTWRGGDPVAIANNVGGVLVDIVEGPSTVVVVRVPTDRSAKTLSLLAADPKVEYAEIDRPMSAPVRPGCSSATTLSGQGCIAFYDGDPTPGEYFAQPAMSALQVDELHALLTGVASTVAVIDTGVDAAHPQLAGRVLPFGFDFVDGDLSPDEVADGRDDDGDGFVDEAFGHGTHVAGTIALINPDAMILPLRVLDSDGNGTSFDVARAIRFAIASGAEVINLSLGMTGTSETVIRALRDAHEAGVEVFAASGNAGSEGVQFPASEDEVVGVTAVDDLDVKASFSSFGSEVTVSAPGTAIYSTMPGGRYARWSGTSMATAVASGAASLLQSLSGEPLDAEAADRLRDTSYSIDHLNPQYGELIGDGRIDPLAAAYKLDD